MSAYGPKEAGCEGASATLHATCLVLGEDGVLITGPSGSGKSSLCLALFDGGERDGRFARLVGDDRIVLTAQHGRLIGRPHPALAGLIEIRGSGLHRLARTAQAAVIRLVVELAEKRERLPEESPADAGATVELLGLRLPVLPLERRQPREYLIRHGLAALRQERHLGPQSARRQDRPQEALPGA